MEREFFSGISLISVLYKLTKNHQAQKINNNNSSSSRYTSVEKSISITMTDHLSLDLMMEIFSRLPVQCLLRFRCVSKSWYNSITEIDRIKSLTVIMFACSTHSVLYPFNFTTSSATSLEPLFTAEMDYPFNRARNAELKFLASCNGLFCVRVAFDFNKYNVICLWNPSTTEFKRLPDEPLEYPGLDSTTIDRQAVYGLGCNRTMNNDYNLIRILLSGDKELGVKFASEVVVYSLRTNSWKTISILLLEPTRPNVPPAPYIPGLELTVGLEETAGVHVNGSLHWISAIISSSRRYLDKNIVSCDIGDESFGVVPKPDSEYIDTYGMSLCVLRGSLGLLVDIFDCRSWTNSVDVWIMKEYGVKESWTPLHRTSINKIPQTWRRQLKVLWLSKNDELLITNNRDGEIFLYDPTSDEVKLIDINRHVKKKWIHTDMYVDNPISLKSSQGDNDDLMIPEEYMELRIKKRPLTDWIGSLKKKTNNI